MSVSVPPEHRRFSFMQAFAARLGGEAMSFLTFAGPLLGEPTKIALLRRRVPLVHGVPALVGTVSQAWEAVLTTEPESQSRFFGAALS